MKLLKKPWKKVKRNVLPKSERWNNEINKKKQKELERILRHYGEL